MPRMHQARKRQQKTIASQRIEQLTRLAEHQALNGDLELAQRYLEHARNIATRVVVPLPAMVKRRVCKNCGTYLLPGVTSRTRVHRGRIIHCCLHCGAYSRHPLHQKTIKSRITPIDDQ
jgi:ribonuclease P protein subunit RPR2